MVDSVNAVRITELGAIGSDLSNDDLLPITDIGTNTTRSVLVSNLISHFTDGVYDSDRVQDQIDATDKYDSARVQGQVDSSIQLNDGYFMYGDFSNNTIKVPLTTIIDSAYVSHRIDSSFSVTVDSSLFESFMQEHGVSTILAPFGMGKLVGGDRGTASGFSWFRSAPGIFQITFNEPQDDVHYHIVTDADQDDLFTNINAKTKNGFELELYQAYTSGAPISAAEVNVILFASDPYYTVFGSTEFDSDLVNTVVDSDYINARIDVDLIPGMGIDSATSILLTTETVDSAYVQARVDASVDSGSIQDMIDSSLSNVLVIAPFAIGQLTNAANASNTEISWTRTVNEYSVTFDTAQPDANYQVITDANQDDVFSVISNQTTTGFTVTTYESLASDVPTTPAGSGFINVLVYGSDPYFPAAGVFQGGGGSGGSGGIDSATSIALTLLTVDSDYINSRVDISTTLDSADYDQIADRIQDEFTDSAEVLLLINETVDSAYVNARAAAQIDYVTTVGYNPANPSDAASIVLNARDILTTATYKGNVINSSDAVVLDADNGLFTGTVMGTVDGNSRTPDGQYTILDVGTDGTDGSLNITDITADGTVDLTSATVLGVDQSIEDLTDTQFVTASLSTDDFLRWNGSSWIGSPFNVDPALEFAGSIDATVDSAPSVSHGVLYAQVGAGTILPSWTGVAGQSIDSGMGLAWAELDSAWHIIGNITDAGVMSVVAGDGILVDDSVPARPVISINRTTIQSMIDSSGYTTANFNDDLATKTTDDLYEGVTNLYYTDARADIRATLIVNSATTDNIDEGTTNLYYTEARIDSALANYNWNTSSGDFHDSDITGGQIDSAISGGSVVTTVNGVGPSSSGDIGIHGGNTQTDAGSGTLISDALDSKVRRITDTNTATSYNPTNGVISLPLATTSSVQAQIDADIDALKFQDSADVATVVDPKLPFGGSSQMTILHASWDASGGTTTPTILSSYGISGITRIDAGEYRVDFMTNMVNANYTVTTGCGTTDYSGTGASPRTVSVLSRANSSVTVLCERTDDAVNEDNEYMSVMIIGNLVSS